MADTASNKEWQRSKFGEAFASNKFWAPQQDEEARRHPYPFAEHFRRSLIFFMEKYSSGRRGVTRNFSVILELPFPNPLFYKGFARCEYNFICLFSPTVLSDFREQME